MNRLSLTNYSSTIQERYIRERVKVNGRTNNLAEANMVVTRNGNKLNVVTGSPVSKRYFKYLTKKFLKKNQLRDWLRVVATDKSTYVVKYFKVGDEEEAEEDQE